MDEVARETARESSRKPGDPNGDGTFYGGGPNDFKCSKCIAAGFPMAIAHGHRANQEKWCPLLQDKPAGADPNLQKIIDDCVPSTTSKTAKIKTKQESEALTHGQNADEILDMIVEGVITSKAAKLALMKLMRGAEAQELGVIQAYIQNIDCLSSEEDRKQTSGMPKLPGSMPDPAKGKLIRLYTSCLKAVRTDMHANIKNDQKQTMKYDLNTGAMILDVPEDDAVPTVAIFNLTLENWRHAVRANDYLGELETHALIVWVGKQFVLSRKLVVIERAVKVMLKTLDNNMDVDLGDLLKTEGRNIHNCRPARPV